MPMTDKTVVVTGGTGGIGLQTAIGLSRLGARVVVTGRNEERARAAVNAIDEASQSRRTEFALGDLMSVSGTTALAGELAGRFPEIAVLINNAGRMAPELSRTVDGLESNFAVNVAAPLVLTRSLLPSLQSASSARVLNLSGGDSGALDPSNLQCENGFDGLNSYSHSKRALEAMSVALSRELAPTGVTVNVVYPGQASTSMTRSVRAAHLPWWMRPFFPLFKFMVRADGGKSAMRASRSSVWGASHPALRGKTGLYFDKHCDPATFHESVLDVGNQARVLEAVNQARSELESGKDVP